MRDCTYIVYLCLLSFDALADIKEKDIKDKHKTWEERQDNVSSEESLETVLPP